MIVFGCFLMLLAFCFIICGFARLWKKDREEQRREKEKMDAWIKHRNEKFEKMTGSKPWWED